MEDIHYYFPANVMYQNKSHNNVRLKEGAPFTDFEQRHSHNEESGVCLQHSCPLELICLTCGSKLLCSQCLQSTLHGNHDFRSIDRARASILSQYQQWMVRLSSKSDILDIIHGQFQSSKAEISLFSKRYKDKLTLQFTEIMDMLERKLNELCSTMDVFLRQYIFEMSAQMERIRTQRKEIERITAKYDKEKTENTSLLELAAHSYEIRARMEQLLDEGDITDYKERLVEPEWKVSNDRLQNIKANINALSVSLKDARREPNISHSHFQHSKIKRTSKKDLKIFDLNEQEKSENKLKQSASSNIFAHTTLTPKNKSKQKKVKQKKSPEAELLKRRKKSAKMVSMPASPAKEVESTFVITPEMSRKKLFKKK